jgi:hypothetical protein|tara:strand:+ start:147 stop:962 length:816 start_codon:yes stop_codon:yes gene_type:complete
MQRKKFLRVLSLGAGVQSTTLSLMIEKGDFKMVDCAIFADTKGEPKLVYEHLNWLEKQVSFPIYKTSWRDLKQDMIDASVGKYKFMSIPLFTKNLKTGKKGILRRQCTFDYKIKPVQQKVRELLGYKKRERVEKGTKVEMLMGISYDEMQRMKINSLKYIENIYPLVEKKIRRHNCLEWMQKNNYPKPPRSACTFCPYHTNLEWAEIKKNKEEWDEVIAIDEMIRHSSKKDEHDRVYLHNSCVPLKDADLRSAEEKGQYSLLDECEGMCGI